MIRTLRALLPVRYSGCYLDAMAFRLVGWNPLRDVKNSYSYAKRSVVHAFGVGKRMQAVGGIEAATIPGAFSGGKKRVNPTESIVTAILTVAASLLSAAMVFLGLATWLEAASTITGAVCVWLTVRENIWNFPIGLVNVATFFVVF